MGPLLLHSCFDPHAQHSFMSPWEEMPCQSWLHRRCVLNWVSGWEQEGTGDLLSRKSWEPLTQSLECACPLNLFITMSTSPVNLCQDSHWPPTCRRGDPPPHPSVNSCFRVTGAMIRCLGEVLAGCREWRFLGIRRVYWEFWKMSRYLQTLKGKGKGSTDKIPLWRGEPGWCAQRNNKEFNNG